MNTCKHPDGCPRPARINGWCKAHYSRIARTGNPGCAEIPKPTRTCAADGCTRIVDGLGGYGYCGKHYQRFRKHGNPDVVAVGGASMPAEQNPHWSDVPSYTAVHQRLAMFQGKASRHLCVDCSAPASEWSYDHADPDEMQSQDGPYSAKASHYLPRCRPCHRLMDQSLINGNRDHCPEQGVAA